jgi:hypothetical protein
MILSRHLIIAWALFIAGCAQASANVYETATLCPAKDRPPTDQEFQRMDFSTLYRWHKMALEADDLLAAATVTRQSLPPCVVALASKNYMIERIMKYR